MIGSPMARCLNALGLVNREQLAKPFIVKTPQLADAHN
jgi:hypothetical protein